MRKLASIQRIEKLEPIEGADLIQKATVLNWQLVTAVSNGFKEGDLIVYIEPDAWVPTTLAPFLTKPGHPPKFYNEVQGEKLRTIRLRGTLSQGLILKLEDCFELVERDNQLFINKSKYNQSARSSDDNL